MSNPAYKRASAFLQRAVAGRRDEDSAMCADGFHRPIHESFFDSGIADEVHELKGDTAQGTALGTIASCADRTIILTGTLNGGYAQAAWWNRIPIAAWGLMMAIVVCSNLLVGYSARRIERKMRRFFILPLIGSIAFVLIAEMDTPRGGFIRVHPQNLESLSRSLRAP